MSSSLFDDPETSYRRGYLHGAFELFQSIESQIPHETRAIVQTWLDETLRPWRSQLQEGETGRAADGSLSDPPPKLRLPANSNEAC